MKKGIKKLVALLMAMTMSMSLLCGAALAAGPGAPPGGAPGGAPGSSSGSVTWTGATTFNSSTSESGKTYASTTADENAVLIDTSDTVTLTNPTVTKSGGTSASDDYSFYGINSGIMAKGGGTTTITGGSITTTAEGANGVFSYGANNGTTNAAGDGTTVNISDTKITTTGNGSGGIMTTYGGTTAAKNLTVTTSGGSSAPIRTDRGGGWVTVNGGTYTSNGQGSPAIYSTADVKVTGATLVSNKSEGVCIEGTGSIALTDCDLTAANSTLNGNASFYDTIMIYQSMSGDASEGTSSFTMTGGSLTSKQGDTFHVTNTSAVITLSDVDITNSSDNVLLSVCDDGWSGNSNVATLNASKQTLKGDVLVGSDSKLTMSLSDGSTFTGSIGGNITDDKGTVRSTSVGTVNMTVNSGCTWKLTGDSTVTTLSGSGSIDYNGHTLTVNGTAYTASNPYSGLSSVDAGDDSSSDTGGTDNTGDSSEGSTVSLSDAVVSKISNQTYTGKAIKPAVKVVLDGKNLTKGTDYTVSYKNNTKVGTATVTITGKGSYTGSVTKTFKILPGKTALSSVTNVKGKKLKVNWKKNTSGTGYEIQYSTSKTFKNNVKTVKISKNSTTSKTISGLKKGKTYYVRIRTVSGSNKSGWSANKSVKVKK